MFARLDIDEIKEYGKALGLNLSSAEARIMQSRMIEQVATFEAFEQLRIEEQRLPLKYTNRDPGYCPTEQEDPLNVFIRKCRVEGADHGPLKGKSIGLKDHISVAGMPLTFGCRFMEHYIPDFDATIVTRILDAGGTIVGKMNMEGFSFGGGGVGGVGDYGRPLNPHNHAHLTGGSSSGSAAAVAANYLDITFGGDQGGSIRLPAAWCGVIGLKPTYGLIPHTGVFGLDPTVDFVGPIARTVEDIATVLECVAGSDGYDPRQVNLPPQLPKYSEILNHGIDGLRIGILSEGFGFEGSEGDVEQATLEAIAILERGGARIEKVSVPLHEKAALALSPIFAEGTKLIFDTNLGGAFVKTYYPSSLIATIGLFKQSHGHELPVNIKLMLIAGAYLQHAYHGRLYAKAQNVRPIFVKQYNDAFTHVDILAMPTIPIKAPAYHEPRNYEEALEQTLFGGQLGLNLGVIIRNSSPFNYTGHPAIAIPCGKSAGLPVSLQLVAPHFGEDRLLRAAYAYQHLVQVDTGSPK